MEQESKLIGIGKKIKNMTKISFKPNEIRFQSKSQESKRDWTVVFTQGSNNKRKILNLFLKEISLELSAKLLKMNLTHFYYF